jgi:hypothetical protein
MANFAPGVEVVTSTPTVTVDGGLRAGVYRFQLVVEDASDRTRPPIRSKPKVLTVVVRETVVPVG